MNFKFRYIAISLLAVLFAACEVIPENDRLIPIDMEESNRKTLLIEFSALKCVNCPNAAEEAHNMSLLHGDMFVVVEMHPASNTLTQAKPEWDYTCEESDIYYKYFGGTNTTPFPTGVINFAQTQDGYFQPYSLWEAAYTKSAGKISHIDIMQIVQADPETRTLSITEGVINLSTEALDVQYIVWLTEDSILGPQMMPDGSLNQQYYHNHILRDAITDVWGEELHIEMYETQFITIEYQLPEKVIMENCNIVGLALKNGEVVQVNEYKLKDILSTNPLE